MKRYNVYSPAYSSLWESVIEFIKPFEKKVLFTIQGDKNQFESVTGEALSHKVKLLGSMLQKKMAPQQKVILLFPQGLEYIYGLMACWHANLVAIPIPITDLTQTGKTAEKIVSILKNSQANCIVAGTGFDEMIKTIQNLHATTVIKVNDVYNSDIPYLEERSKLPEELALLLYTSGSSSQPKGVMLSHGNLMSQAGMGAKQWEIDSESCIVSWMPQFHNFGLHFNILVPLLKGAHSIILSPDSFTRNAKGWFECIAQHQATHTAAPNFAFDYCSSTIKVPSGQSLEELSLRSLKAIICGGEPVNRQSYENFIGRFQCLGLAKNIYCPHYGLSETGSVTTSKPGQAAGFISLDIDSLEKNKVKHSSQATKVKVVASCGKIEKDVKIVIVDRNTRKPCLKGNIGEIWIRSPSVALGYLNSREETENIFSATLNSRKKDQVFMRTGDLGFIEDGHLYVAGREKDLIIINGKNHHPVDIEWTIKRNIPHLNLAITVFSREIEHQEKVVVVQEVEAGLKEADYKAIICELLKTVSENHNLKIYEINLVGEKSIPRTGSGKIQRQACKALHRSQKLLVSYKYIDGATCLSTDARKGTLDTDYENSAITKTLKKKVFLNELRLDIKTLERINEFSELALDSIQYVNISKRIEETFEFLFAPVMLFKHNSFSKLAHYISEQIDTGRIMSDLSEDIGMPMQNHKNTRQQKGILSSVTQDFKHSISEHEEELVAIIGMSCHFPGRATDPDSFWENLLGPKSCITPIPISRTNIISGKNSGFETAGNSFPKWGGFIREVDTFDAEFFGISPLEAESMDPQQRKTLELTWSVIESAGYNPKQLAGQNVGLYMGAHNSDYLELMMAQPSLTGTYGAYSDSGVHMSMIANRTSRWFNFNGPSEVINTACSSSLVAVHHAAESIAKGSCGLAIAGGINLILSPRIYRAAHSAGMLSVDGACKTFDQKANGFVRAEGYGAVLLKSYRQAKIDDDLIYGVIKAAVINHDGKSNSLRAPNIKSQKQLIQTAYQTAGLHPETVNYIEAHGTGTPLGDPIETEALKEAFEAMNTKLPHNFCGLGSVKTNIGHCESAAGIAGLIKVLLAIKHKTLPGILHFNRLNESISLKNTPFYVVEKNQPWHRLKNSDGQEIYRRAGISSFGFGGVNAHVLIEEAAVEKHRKKVKTASGSEDGNKSELILLSARSVAQLYKVVNNLHQYLVRHQSTQENPQLEECSESSLQNIAYTLQVGREAMRERLATIATSRLELLQKLQGFLEGKENEQNWYKGHVNKESDINPLFESDEGLKVAVDRLLKMGEINKLGRLWVNGIDLNWNILHEQRSPSPVRISLPTYPFAKTRYWIPEATTPQEPEIISKKSNQISTNNLTAQQTRQSTVAADAAGIEDSDIACFVKNAIARNTGHTIESLDLSAADSDIGVDSIVRLQLVNEIVKAYPELDLSQNELLVLPSMSAIVDSLQREKNNKHKTGYPELPNSSRKNSTYKKKSENTSDSRNLNLIVQKIKKLPDNIIIKNVDSESEKLEAVLVITESHTFFNDHPVDHVTGVQLIEAMAQLTKVFQAYRSHSERYYTASMNVVFNGFCEKTPANVFCSEIEPEPESTDKSLNVHIQQNQKTICKGTFVVKDIDGDNTKPTTQKVALGKSQFELCEKSIVHKRNSENVFISTPCTYENKQGCWFLPTRSSTIFNDSADEMIDTTQLIEACRQYEHVLTKKSFFQSSTDMNLKPGEGEKNSPSRTANEGIGVLKSIDIRLSKLLHIGDEIFITSGDMDILTVADNRLIKWKNILLVNNVEVGTYKMEALLLNSEVYDTWRDG